MMMRYRIIDNGNGEILGDHLTFEALTCFLRGVSEAKYHNFFYDGVTVIAYNLADIKADDCEV
jgi:hypothetical protein